MIHGKEIFISHFIVLFVLSDFNWCCKDQGQCPCLWGLGHSGVWDCMSGEIQWNHYSSCKHPGETLNKVATWSYDKSAEVLSPRLCF